jgi:hypothetical protein
MRRQLKRYGLICALVFLLGVGSLAIASKISVGTAVSFPVDI